VGVPLWGGVEGGGDEVPLGRLVAVRSPSAATDSSADANDVNKSRQGMHQLIGHRSLGAHRNVALLGDFVTPGGWRMDVGVGTKSLARQQCRLNATVGDPNRGDYCPFPGGGSGRNVHWVPIDAPIVCLVQRPKPCWTVRTRQNRQRHRSHGVDEHSVGWVYECEVTESNTTVGE